MDRLLYKKGVFGCDANSMICKAQNAVFQPRDFDRFAMNALLRLVGSSAAVNPAMMDFIRPRPKQTHRSMTVFLKTISLKNIFISLAILCCGSSDISYAENESADESVGKVEATEESTGQLLAADAIVVPEALRRAELARVAAIKKAVQATVGIFGAQGQGGGSGVVISPDGYALTNYHVVEGNGAFMKCSMPDGVLYDAVIVGIDPTGDVALVKLLGRDDFPTATIADSDDVKIGDWCFAIGNPFLLATNFQPSVSMGIISGKNRYQYPAGTLLEYADCLQTDAAINPGNSGGALFNSNGDLIGINGRGSFEKRGRVNVGVGYAISINQINYFLDHLKSGRLVDHATLGATVESDDQGVVRVSDVLPSSDAFRRGLRYDDVILSFAGRNISTVNQFKNVLGILPKGYTAKVVYRRDDEPSEIMVRLAGVHATGQLAEIIEGKPAGMPELPVPRPPEGDPNPPMPPQSPQPTEGVKTDDQKDHPYRHLYIRRSGFTNYYFNQQIRNRIWQQFTAIGGDWSQQPGRWRIMGKVRDAAAADEVPFQLLLGDEKSGIKIGDSSFVLDPTEDFSQQLFPPESGGLLVALHLWRSMMIEGPEKFGDVYYFGGLPSRNSADSTVQKIADVLIGTRGVIETHFLFDRKNSLLQSAEMFPAINSDPCRLMFLDYQRDGDLLIPRQITFDAGFGTHEKTLVIERIEFMEQRTDGGKR